MTRFEEHRLVALPERTWEGLKIGGGTPPIRIAEGWLVLYHGASGTLTRDLTPPPDLRYCAGALILDAADVTRVVARSITPLLEPTLPEERSGIVAEVVFPTAIEAVQGSAPAAYDIYYGMADSRIGVARMRRTDSRPEGPDTYLHGPARATVVPRWRAEARRPPGNAQSRGGAASSCAVSQPRLEKVGMNR